MADEGKPTAAEGTSGAPRPFEHEGSSQTSQSGQPQQDANKPVSTQAGHQAEEAAAAGDESSGDSDKSDDFGIDMKDLLVALDRHEIVKTVSQAPTKPKLLPSFDLAGVAQYIKEGRASRIICMCGAGISVSAGIPDFRTPGTGLYSQLERYNLPNPEAVFEIGYFRRNPQPFHLLAKELFPGHYSPTPTHVFIKLLHDKGLLLRCYTQNIDSLEAQAGLPKEKVVAAHGNFDSAHCISCGEEHDVEYVREAVMADKICTCKICMGLVKPDIVFFGEQLPARFFELYQEDFPAADLLMVMGTSLVVNPFAALIDAVDEECPRVLINRERVGEQKSTSNMIAMLLACCSMGGGGGFVFPPPEYYQESGSGKGGSSSSSGSGSAAEAAEAESEAGFDASSSTSGSRDPSMRPTKDEVPGVTAAAAAGASGQTEGDSNCSGSGAHQGQVQQQQRDAGGCYRDALFLGDCDAGVRQLVGMLGWEDEFEKLLAEVRSSPLRS